MSHLMTSSPYASGRGAFFVVVFLIAPSTHAADPVTDDLKRACVAQHEAAQLLRRAGKLTEAREAMVACSQNSCPAVVTADCAAWRAAVGAEIPSVVVNAKVGGHDENNVSVTVDGTIVASRLDGRPIELDPGTHRFRFDTATHDSIEEQVTLVEGEKGRDVTVAFASPPSPPSVMADPSPSLSSVDAAPDMRRPVPTVAYVFGGVAAAGVGVLTGFGIWGLNERLSLRSSCSPSCSNSQVSSVRTKFIVADAGLGVAVLSFAGATYAYLTRPAVRRKTASYTGYVVGSSRETTVALAPLSLGAIISVQGGF